MKRLITFSALLFAACGDDTKGTTADAGVDTLDVDAAIDAPGFVAPTPFLIDISADGPDQIMSVAPGPSGSFYAAGYAADGAAGVKYLFVAKLTSAGALDTTFATGGIYTSALEFKGGMDEIDIGVQSDGKIVVAGTIANNIDAADRDIGLFRVDATGAIDTTFGTDANGTARVNLSVGRLDTSVTPNVFRTDSQRGLAVGPNDLLFLHAAARNDVDNGGMRNDTDFAVARLTADGVIDAANYGTLGKYLLNLNETDNAATPKGLHVLSDGTVIASGYARTSIASPPTPQPVLYRLTPAGALDTTSWSAGGGLFHEVVLTKQTEIYAFAVDNNNITTAGYGRETGDANVWASLRFNVNTGARDASFGGAAAGAVLVDPTGTVAGSNCRNAIGLNGGKTALIGSAGPSGSRDAALAILTKNGALDTTFGTGVHTFDMGGTEDQWWGGAVNGGQLFVAGWRGVGSTQTDVANDNSYGILLGL